MLKEHVHLLVLNKCSNIPNLAVFLLIHPLSVSAGVQNILNKRWKINWLLYWKMYILARRAGHGHEPGFRFMDAVNRYLKNWDVKQQFEESKNYFEEILFNKARSSKFNGICWNREKLSETVLHYSALHGLATYQLYVETLKDTDLADDIFQYPPSTSGI